MLDERNRQPSEGTAGTIDARVAALEMMVVILLSRVERAELGLLDSMKEELAQLKNAPSRKDRPNISDWEAATASLIDQALKATSASAGPVYRWKLRARRIVQKWRGARPPL